MNTAYYHGTVKAWLPSILKEGLIPNKNMWKAVWGVSGRDVASTEEKGVYVTTSKEDALIFAKGKVNYLKATP